MRESHHGLVAKSGRLARGRIHLRKPQCQTATLRLQKRSGPYISLCDILQDLFFHGEIGDGPA